MRQDPDVVLVGEIRDTETMETALRLSETGHLVLSTLHTNDSASAVTRLLDLGVPSFLLNATLLGVMAQRLVRTLCPHCKAPHDELPEAQWDALTRPYRARRPATSMRCVGCMEGRMTGYKGRAGLYEILTMTEDVKALVSDKPELRRIRDRAMRDGMKPLRLAGAMKIAAGLTTVEEVLRAAPPADR
jgi:general secretion pathway protein E